MPGFVELDKPSTAPIRGDPDDGIQIADGRLFRDSEGHVAYPSHVPPEVQSPRSNLEHAATPDPKIDGPKKSQSDPLPPSSSEPSNAKAGRPSVEANRKFVSEAPQRVNRYVSSFPLIKRAGTDVPPLNRAIWDSYNQADDLSSSSSSEDEGETHPQPGGSGDGPPRPRRMKSDDKYRRFKIATDKYHTKGKVKRDGRLNITVNDTSNTGYLAKALGSAVKKVVPTPRKAADKLSRTKSPTPSRLSSATTATGNVKCPRLNIVIMVIGSRGDAQPFLKIGKTLKEEYGHRVRIATHPAFQDFVERDSGLEFFSVGGDPSELMAFMVKNPGMIPKLESVKAGDIGRRRAAMAEMFEGFWRACINATDNEKDIQNLKMMGEKTPFVADAIIANPPSFAHIHCAEALGIPLHLMFTFPYTPTTAFPHPLASIKKSNVDTAYTNFMSYPLVEMMVWQGLGDLVNNFRVKTLGLDPVSTLWAPGSTYRLHVPYSYLWSPGLVPKPEDWGDEVDISGFVFLDLASSYKPSQDLVDFLEAGESPIYIGFGSIVVDDADKFTEMIFEAVEQAGVRALVSKGWGGFGGDNAPDNIFMLDNVPHDWLFPKVRACVIHGGAGTTAIALKCGKPTMIVPFFGDQHFWGAMVSSAGVGPEPCQYKKLSAEKLAEGIKYCLTDEAAEAAHQIAQSIELEGDGAKNAVRSFHRHLTLSGENSMRCSILSDRVAVWKVKNTSLKLSALAADLLVGKEYLSWRKLRLIRHQEWNDFEGPGEPVTGVAGSLVGTVGAFFTGFGSVPYRIAKMSTKRVEHKKRKKERRRQKRQRKQDAPAPKQAPVENGLAKKNNSTENNSSGFPFPGQDVEAQDHQPDVQTQRPRGDTGDTQTSGGDNNSTADTATPGPEEFVNQVSEGIGQSGRALAHAPVDLALAIAQGFHNAPRLYGDDTVRRPIRVTGIRSGLHAARDEFVYGWYDGITGIVRLPIKGAKEEGVCGAFAGFGMGLGGLVLKPLGAIAAPIGYTLKGIVKQAERGGQPVRYIRRARILQAQREMRSLSEDERKQVCEEVYKGCDVFQQLAELIMLENTKRRIIGQRFEKGGDKNGKKRKTLGKWGKGRAFENVEVAERAIAAVKAGEKVDVVLGKSRKSIDLRASRKSEDKRSNRKSEVSSRKDGDKTSQEQKVDEEAAKIDESASKNASEAVEEEAKQETLPLQKLESEPTVSGHA